MSEPIDPAGPPADVTHLVRQRTEARARRDWPAADALKAQIEAEGWKVTDHGGRTSVSRAAVPVVVVEGEVRYGSAAAVPSRLDEPADAPWSVVIVASEAPDAVSKLLDGLRAHAPAGTQVVVVTNDPSEAQQAALAAGASDRRPIAGREIEVLRTVTRLGYASTLNIALRRAAGELVLFANGSAWPVGDALTPLSKTLEDPDVAAAGAFGLTSSEPGRLRPASIELSDEPNAGALLGGWLAFRRSDLIALGPLDERFVTPAWLDVWWSLRLRAGEEPEMPEAAEEPEDGEPGAEPAEFDTEPASLEFDLPAPRRAVRLELPLEHDALGWPPDRSRLGRRNMYRVLERFGWRPDLF